jgi:hypothetical protein
VTRLTDDIILLAAMATILSALCAAALFATRKLWRFGRLFVQFLQDFSGTPERPGVEAVPGVMARLRSIESSQADLKQDRAIVKADLERAASSTAAVLHGFELQIAEVHDTLAVVHHEVVPNGGNSIKDQITRVDEALKPTIVEDGAQ